MHYFLNLFRQRTLYVSDRLLSIIRSLNTVYTAIGICHASYVDCLLASSILTSLADANRTKMTNTYCFVYSVETPDDG
jgi:hypothetical protein